MESLKNARTWGGIGAIFSLFYVTYLVGFVLKLFAVKNIAEATKKESIFKDYIWAALLNITASLILSWAFYDMWDKMADVIHDPEKVTELMSAFGTWSLVAVIIMIIGVWFMKKSYDAIARETGVGTFHTAALFYLIGAILALLMVGYFFILVGALLEIMAFFALPEELPGAVNEKPAPEPATEQTVEIESAEPSEEEPVKASEEPSEEAPED
ncbi:DUF996 domain-containing protein [Thermococcus aciditolerans]|uniref:DUF996 domain-containing protein n=1 Tax=Thermococcus aciditolerans TaxID=2598455 RepID=A0A5C0SJG6_9EURY|nr:DUF996 domain-containing protein [Thermococcus aciditolerans]QEK14400.1 DUF996 domain-containing protein [Thermococcus aciditolerans]